MADVLRIKETAILLGQSLKHLFSIKYELNMVSKTIKN